MHREISARAEISSRRLMYGKEKNNLNKKHEVCLPQNTTVQQNSSFFISFKILGKHDIYFIFVSIY